MGLCLVLLPDGVDVSWSWMEPERCTGGPVCETIRNAIERCPHQGQNNSEVRKRISTTVPEHGVFSLSSTDRQEVIVHVGVASR